MTMLRIASCVFLLLSLGCATAGPKTAPPPEISAAVAAEIAGAPPTIGGQVVDVSARVLRSLGLPPVARGALLHEVLRQGPADRARLAPGDLIQAIDGAPVETVCELLKAISERSPGTKVTLSVLRAQAHMEVVLTLADTARLFKASCDAGDAKGCQSLGAIYTLLGKSPESAKAAASLYTKACEGGAAVGCSSLGSSYLEGREWSRTRPARSASSSRPACTATPRRAPRMRPSTPPAAGCHGTTPRPPLSTCGPAMAETPRGATTWASCTKTAAAWRRMMPALARR